MDYMQQAISLARLALGQVSPNPAVGAVIVKDGEVVGQGYTQPPGSEHAEIVALKAAGDKALNAAMYVTLEPCSIYGRTPPCTKAIISAGIKEVHISMIDPNPLINGKGLKELEAANIKTTVGKHAEDASELLESYIKYTKTAMPFVTVKYAMSLDGKIATRTGDSKWISSDESRRFVHLIRHTSDAIMVGANTVLADDPRLTSRCSLSGGTAKRQPLRIIIDASGRIPASARIFQVQGKVLMVLGEDVSKKQQKVYTDSGADIISLPLNNGKFDFKELLKVLGERHITSIIVEGGATLLGSLFDQQLVDKVVVFISPIIIGGENAVSATGGIGADKIINSSKLERIKVRQLDSDVMITGYPGSN